MGLASEPGLLYLRVDANEALSLGVEFLLERDDDGLEVAGRLLLDVIGHLRKGPPTLSRAEVLALCLVFSHQSQRQKQEYQGEEIVRRGR